jgi:phospho-N-acetylmuramoyl-pentapeptide-transferase
MFMVGIATAALPFAVATDANMLLPLGVMVAGGLLGGLDDFQTLEGRQKLTGHERWFFVVKWGVLLAIGAVLAAVLYFDLDYEDVLVPHFGDYSLGVLYLPVVAITFVVAVSGGAITDGMDGLMAGVSAFAYAAYGAIALVQGQDELAAVCFAVVGALGGFLWYNAYPAQVFMGDAGSLALSAGLVAVAFMSGWWLLLPVIGIVFVVEGVSDVIQIGYFKMTGGKRVFKMAPIHYHFQMSGWTETQVVMRFWIVGILGGFTGLALAMVD